MDTLRRNLPSCNRIIQIYIYIHIPIQYYIRISDNFLSTSFSIKYTHLSYLSRRVRRQLNLPLLTRDEILGALGDQWQVTDCREALDLPEIE